MKKELIDINLQKGETNPGDILLITENTLRAYISNSEGVTIATEGGPKTLKCATINGNSKVIELVDCSDMVVDGHHPDRLYNLLLDGLYKTIVIYAKGNTDSVSISNVVITGGSGAAFECADKGKNPVNHLSLTDSFVYKNGWEGVYFGHVSTAEQYIDSADVENVTFYLNGRDDIQAKGVKRGNFNNFLSLECGVNNEPQQRNSFQMEQNGQIQLSNFVALDCPNLLGRFRIGEYKMENFLIGLSQRGFYCDQGTSVHLSHGYVKHMGYMRDKPVFNSNGGQKVTIGDGVIFDKAMQGWDFGNYEGEIVFGDIPRLELEKTHIKEYGLWEPMVSGYYKDKGMGKKFPTWVESETMASPFDKELPKPEFIPDPKPKPVDDEFIKLELQVKKAHIRDIIGL